MYQKLLPTLEEPTYLAVSRSMLCAKSSPEFVVVGWVLNHPQSSHLIRSFQSVPIWAVKMGGLEIKAAEGVVAWDTIG